jgi:hypothetical protein
MYNLAILDGYLNNPGKDIQYIPYQPGTHSLPDQSFRPSVYVNLTIRNLSVFSKSRNMVVKILNEILS